MITLTPDNCRAAPIAPSRAATFPRGLIGVTANRVCVHAFVAITATVASLVGAKADRITDVSGKVAIIDLAVEPARKGGFAEMSVTIENNSSASVRITRVETTQAEPGSFDYHGRAGSIHSHEFTIGAGEQVHFDKENAKLVIGPLRRDLAEGAVVDVTFTFDAWSTTIPAHVHGSGRGAD